MRQLLGPSALLLLFAVACGTPEPKRPHATQPPDERRALTVIAEAYRDAGMTAIAGRDIRLTTGHTVHADVGTEGHKFGVAYLTSVDQKSLDAKNDLPPHTPGGDLPVVQGAGPDADAVILLLFADDYQDDDFVGAGHEATGITAERKLARDVRDFLAQARLRKLP